MDDVDQVRSFNRTVTERVGALQDAYLGRGRPLGENRVLWEIADGTDLRALRARLGLDSGYLSRLIGSITAPPHRIESISSSSRRPRTKAGATSPCRRARPTETALPILISHST